ncbi:MAG: hypothetical protein K8S62_11055 [Candidatus Sabulitectum sp.]|nr:hypothetical protein [Candidatus Sabulitectum sp.]
MKERLNPVKNNFWRTFLLTLAFFGGLYMLLVFSERISYDLYDIVGWGTGLISVAALMLTSRKGWSRFTANMQGIVSGLFLWGFIGEFMEVKYGLVVAASSFLPILAVFVILFVVVRRGKQLAIPTAFAAGHFLGIWGLHMWMIYQFEHLSRTHWSTYLSAAVALLFGTAAVILGKKSEKLNRKMALALTALLLLWTVLEYVWGWRLIPGPYSMG